MDLKLIRAMAEDGVSVDDRIVVLMVDYINQLESIIKQHLGKLDDILEKDNAKGR